jgi:hypothetical protein
MDMQASAQLCIPGDRPLHYVVQQPAAIPPQTRPPSIQCRMWWHTRRTQHSLAIKAAPFAAL